MSPARKIESWIANAITPIAPSDTVNVELATVSMETESISRIVIDCVEVGTQQGFDPSDGERTATVTITYISSVDNVAADFHDDFAGEIEAILSDEVAMFNAAISTQDFHLTYYQTGSFTTTTGGEGTRLRMSALNISAIFRNDSGKP